MAEAGDWYLQRIGFSETIYSLPQNGEVWVKRYQPKKKKKNISGNNIFLSSPRVSREHAKLTVINNVWHVIDCESMNGVFINGIRVPKNEVKSVSEGDLVGFGAAEATEQYYYVFELVRRKNLQTEKMNTDLIIKEEPQDDSLSQFTQPDPLRIVTQKKAEEHDETLQATCPNLQVEGHMELEDPNLDETMPMLTEQTENECDSDIAAVDKNQDPTTSSVLKTKARMPNLPVTNLSPRDPTVQDDSNSSAPPSLQIFGASDTLNRLDGRPTENVFNFGFVSEVRRSLGKVRGRPRRRGRRGMSSSRWSPINYLPTERTAMTSARVASETAPSTWNIGCRVTRNVSAKLQSGQSTTTSSPAQSERQTLNCDEEANSRTEESTSTENQPSVAGSLHSPSPIESFQSSSNTSTFETATLPTEDSASSELSNQSFTGQHSDSGPVGDDLKRRLLSEVCAVFQDLLSAESADFDEWQKRLDGLKQNICEMTMDPNFELNEPIRVVSSNNKCFDTLNSKDQYHITLPVPETSCPVEIIDSLRQTENVCLGAGAWRDGYGVHLTAEQSEAIKQAKAYALETSVDLLMFRGLKERYNM